MIRGLVFSEETRFMVYDSIIHGVNGIMYWGLSYVPPDHSFIQDLTKVLNEVQELAPVILGRTLLHKPLLRYRERGSTIARGVEILCKRASDGIYILAANTSIDPAAVDFLALPPELASAKSLSVVGENRKVTVSNGSFFDEFDGLGVHVYVASPQL